MPRPPNAFRLLAEDLLCLPGAELKKMFGVMPEPKKRTAKSAAKEARRSGNDAQPAPSMDAGWPPHLR